MESTITVKDFGEKIGGAKKDLWSKRGLYIDDLDMMNDREADKYVKKDNVWKKPDYQALIDGGIPSDVVYYIKVVRDSLAVQPRYSLNNTIEDKLKKQKQYIETVREIQTIVESVKSKQDVFTVVDKFLIHGGYAQRVPQGVGRSYVSLTKKGIENPVITSKLFEAMHICSEKNFEYKISKKAAKAQFGIAKDNKMPTGYAINFNDGKNTYSENKDWKAGTFYVTKGYQILKMNFENRDAALKWAQDHAKQYRNGARKKRFVPEQLANVRRTGPDYRSGREVTGEDYLNTFGFRGGEFGNWMSQNDRQESLNMGFDALKDLAYALEISEKDISYQGTLAIAFGARGSGNAVAHYEPLQKVINLTKMRGAGSLAHEWWHGLDDYLGNKMGANGFLSDHPRNIYAPFQKLIDAIKYKLEPLDQTKEHEEGQDRLIRAERQLDSAILPSLIRADNEEALKEYDILKSKYLQGNPKIVDEISNLKKKVAGHVIPKDRRSHLMSYARILQDTNKCKTTARQVKTNYYQNSIKMAQECNKDGGYWDSNIEMTARAFATYILDKLPYRSDYLCGHAECALTFDEGKDGKPEILRAYPEGEERVAINAVFDELFLDLKKQGYLTDKS